MCHMPCGQMLLLSSVSRMPLLLAVVLLTIVAAAAAEVEDRVEM